MHTACFSDSWGSAYRDPQTETLWTETLLDRDPPRQRTPYPPEGTWDQAVRQEVTSYKDLPVNRMTENITLRQTSFADGNKHHTVPSTKFPP